MKSPSNSTDDHIGLPGLPLGNNQGRNEVLTKIRELCGWNRNSFPGSQPVSLSRNNINLLYRDDYVVCEKSDGIRAMLLAASGALFLIGRKEEVHRIDMVLPLRGSPGERHQLTLLDGELVKDNQNGILHCRYLIYDAISIHRQSVRNYNLLERLSMVYKEIIQPLIKIESKQNIDLNKWNTVDFHLEIYLKDFFDLSHIPNLRDISRLLPHTSDGLIFTPVNQPYIPGTCKQLLKWKPPHLNTVDFSVDILYDEKGMPRMGQLFASVSGARVFYNEFLSPYGRVYKELLESALNEHVVQRIVECGWIPDKRVWTFIPNIKKNNNNINRISNDGKLPYDFDNGEWVLGGWVAERIRVDKKDPNNINVITNVRESIEDDITFGNLVNEIIQFMSQGKKPVWEKCFMPSHWNK